MKIAVLYRNSDETDNEYLSDCGGSRVECCHVTRLKQALERLGHSAEIVDLTLDNFNYLKSAGFDLAFNLCDDGFDNNSLFEAHIPAILDILKVPYTGADFYTLATCVNKARTKEILSYHNVPTPLFQIFASVDEKISSEMSFPLIVKPLHEDASIGIKDDSVVCDEEQLRTKVRVVLETYCQPALVEEFIDGREIYVGMLGCADNLAVLPLSEIIFDGKARICSYEAKWEEDSSAFQNTPVKCPAQVSAGLKNKLVDTAVRAYNLLGCRDYGRVDFRVDKNNRPYVLEVNPNPDISDDAGLARMAGVWGLNYDELISRIVNYAVERQKKIELEECLV